jgi:hypothetical protein
MEPRVRRALACTAASEFGGVISRARLRALGITKEHVRAEVKADRWVAHGTQTISVHTRPLSPTEQMWRAVWEVGERIAALDGVSALAASGLAGFVEDVVHVSIVRTARRPPVEGVRLHKVTKRQPGELITAGVCRVRPEAAALRAAHWAVSDRQAALVLAMSVQQRLVSGARLVQATRVIKGRRRRAFVAQVVRDLADGSHSLGELDFAALCRARGLPEPVRQVIRRGPRGRVYLDVRWECGVVVEIDGSQHRIGLAVTDDNLRQNSVTIGGDLVLRIDLLGLRLYGDQFLDQVAAALASRGWR